MRRHAMGAQVVEQRIWTEASGTKDPPQREQPCRSSSTISPRVLSAVVLSTMQPGAAHRTRMDAAVGDAARAARVTRRIRPIRRPST